MDIPNYDFNEDEHTNFKQLYKYMPKSNFRMLICGNSGSGKTPVQCFLDRCFKRKYTSKPVSVYDFLER